jgi:hypothetical protein
MIRLAILAGLLALTVRILLLLSGFLTPALLARLLAGILVLLAGILVLIGHRDLLFSVAAAQRRNPALVSPNFSSIRLFVAWPGRSGSRAVRCRS